MRALNHIKHLGGGQSQPELFDDEVGEQWVLKLSGNPQSDQLGHDLVGLRLASALGTPTPEFAIVDVDEVALSTMQPRPAWAVAGPSLGTRFIRPAIVADVPSFLRVSNRNELGSLLVADAWLETLDRQRPDGLLNLLIRTDVENGAFVAIDFGYCLQPTLDGQAAPLLPNSYPIDIASNADRENAAQALQRLGRIETQAIEDAVAAVPSEWMNSGRRTAILKILCGRRDRLLSTGVGGLTPGAA